MKSVFFITANFKKNKPNLKLNLDLSLLITLLQHSSACFVFSSLLRPESLYAYE